MLKRCLALPAALLASLALVLTACSSGGKQEQPPAPQFTLTERSGNKVSSQDLRGKAYLASFIFTSCTEECPLMTAQMALVQQALDGAGLLGAKVMLVSFSFDPEHDTPQRLREYADTYHADPNAWLFLTGTDDQVRQVVQDGFGVFYQRSDDMSGHAATHGEEAVDFVHSNVFVLVDGKGRIRQEYVTSILDVSRVVADIRKVVG